jgi:hypothetical protein
MEQSASKIPLTVNELEKLGFYEFDEQQWQHENQHGPEIYVVKRIHTESGLDTFQLTSFGDDDEPIAESDPFHYLHELKEIYTEKFQLTLA